MWAVEIPESTPIGIPAPTKEHNLIFPKQFTNWEQCMKYMSLWGTILFKPQSPLGR